MTRTSTRKINLTRARLVIEEWLIIVQHGDGRLEEHKIVCGKGKCISTMRQELGLDVEATSYDRQLIAREYI